MAQSWLVGQTILLNVVVTDPVTQALVDPTSVTLASLTVGSTSLSVTGYTFTRLALGNYQARIDTTGFAPGTYTWLVRLTDALGGVSLGKDSIVLSAV